MNRAVVAAICLVLPTAAQAQSDYRLVWSDEFDQPGQPDSTNWTYERGFVRNEELQWYQPENARVENGMLIIEARRESKPNPTYQPGSDDWRRSRPEIDYTSASLTTRGRHSWQYGRFEMRARIDTRPGMWPAFWTLGVSGRWPAGGEIDIMEYYRGMVLANVAWARDEPGRAFWDDLRKPIDDYPRGWEDEFHVWRMDWTPERIELYLDDELLNSTDLSETVNFDGRNPFHAPHYLIVNLAVGGTNGGDPSATEFPARYEIDYIRVYQRD
ncbi:MAG TPA: glycoside hydrolase family 16 protein [Longimicrobiaceae bacterium]